MRLKYLRVNPQNLSKATAVCAEELQALLACWRLNGVDSPSCLSNVGALAACSSASAKTSSFHQLQPSINYKLNRMFNSRSK